MSSTNLKVGEFYTVKTASGTDQMKLKSVTKTKAVFHTYNSFGYGGQKPLKVTIDLTGKDQNNIIIK